jgi:hypothetical protein
MLTPQRGTEAPRARGSIVELYSRQRSIYTATWRHYRGPGFKFTPADLLSGLRYILGVLSRSRQSMLEDSSEVHFASVLVKHLARVF